MNQGLHQPAVDPIRADGGVHASPQRAHQAGFERQNRCLDLPAAHIDEDHKPAGATLGEPGNRGQGRADLRAQ